jgi:hypothetical protein
VPGVETRLTTRRELCWFVSVALPVEVWLLQVWLLVAGRWTSASSVYGEPQGSSGLGGVSVLTCWHCSWRARAMQSSAVASRRMPHSHPPCQRRSSERQSTVSSFLPPVPHAFMESWFLLRAVLMSRRKQATISPPFRECVANHLLWSCSLMLTPPIGLAMADQLSGVDLLSLMLARGATVPSSGPLFDILPGIVRGCEGIERGRFRPGATDGLGELVAHIRKNPDILSCPRQTHIELLLIDQRYAVFGVG